MASQAEVDLIVNATRTLPQLERDLDRVLTAAQDDMSDLDVNAVLRSTQSLNDMERDLDRIIRQATDDADPVAIQAALRQRDALRDLQSDLNAVVTAVNEDGSADALTVLAALNVPDSLADLHDDVVDVVRLVQATAPKVEIEAELDKDRHILRGALTAAGGIGKLTASVVLLSAALGSVAPLIAGVVTSVQNILPASAVATTGIVALALSVGTLKLGMQGVSDAITDAFDPDTKAEDLDKALKNLAPSARKFVKEVAGMKKEFKELRMGVQERLFKNFDEVVRGLGDEVMPKVQKALNATAVVFNKMAIGVAQAAVKLSREGVLGKALDGATKGLKNLTGVPGQLTTSFGLLAAAAAPAFDRVTKAVARLSTSIVDKLSRSFESGGLEKAINKSLDAVNQLGRIFGNVFKGIGNIIKAVSVEGDGLFGTLERVTKAFRDVTANTDVQAGLKALAETASLVSKTVLPLLGDALKIVGRVLVSLSKPVQSIVSLLGNQLGNILDALGPVLESLAGAFGKLLIALAPIISLAGQLITAILPILVPQFEAFGQVFEALTPFVNELATTIGLILLPVIGELPGMLDQVLPLFVQFAQEVMPQLTDTLRDVAPAFTDLGVQLAAVLVAATPLIITLLELSLAITGKLAPVISGILIGVLASLSEALAGVAWVVSNVLIPAVRVIVGAFKGDLFDSTSAASKILNDFGGTISRVMSSAASTARTYLGQFAATARTKATDAKNWFMDGVNDLVDRAVARLRALPGLMIGALGNLGNLLYKAGADLIGGLVNGIQSKIGSVTSTLSNLTSKLPDWKGPAEVDARILTPSGELLIDGLIAGIQRAAPRVRAELQGLTGQLPEFGPQLAGVSAPAAAAFSPVVHVSIGNEAVDQYVTVRSEQVYDQRARIAAQGVRF